MWPARFWAILYWPLRYWGKIGAAPAIVSTGPQEIFVVPAEDWSVSIPTETWAWTVQAEEWELEA